MAIKTISLELDAYEKLKRAKRGSESFSQVVRRARFDTEDSTGAAIVKELNALYGSDQGLSEESLTSLEALYEEKQRASRISPDKWEDA